MGDIDLSGDDGSYRTTEEIVDSHIAFYLSFGLNLGRDEFGDYPQGVIEHKGSRYVVERTGFDRLTVLGEYDSGAMPTNYEMFGYKPLNNQTEIQRQIDEALASDDGEGVFGWAPVEFVPY